MRVPTLLHDIEWRHARRWTGRRVVLRERWRDIEAGTPCRVMCVVDFGDGPLFWIKTDDSAQRDVDQVTRRELEIHFHVPGNGAAPEPRSKRARTSLSPGATGPASAGRVNT